MQIHAAMSIDAMQAGKHVLSEVAAAMTIDECWGLIHAAEKTGKIYMLSENCCYYESVMAILNMVRKGIFGELTYAECGYVHDCSSLMFEVSGALTWRGEMARDYCGNLYPTHSLGPVARWMEINRGDRLVSLVAASTGQSCFRDLCVQAIPGGAPRSEDQVQGGRLHERADSHCKGGRDRFALRHFFAASGGKHHLL